MNLTLQTPGWRLLDEKLKTKRLEALEEFVRTRDENHLKVVDGIDILYQEIKSIFDQAEIEKQSEKV